MIDLNTPIVPYKGTGIFELNAHYYEIVTRMKAADIEYSEKIRNPKNIAAGVLPWTIITIGDDDIELFFAKDRLFEIVLLNNFKGALPNGITLDTPIEEAQKLDPMLKLYDPEDGIYISSEGYSIEDSLIYDNFVSISIFIPARLQDDFYEYNW